VDPLLEIDVAIGMVFLVLLWESVLESLW